MPDLDFAGRYDAGDLHKSRCEGTGCPLGATDEPLAVEPGPGWLKRDGATKTSLLA
jgi:hypothetical protein